MKLNLTNKLVLSGVLLVALPLLFICAYGIHSTSATLTGNARRELHSKSDDIAKAIRLLMRSELQVPTGIGGTESIIRACLLEQQQGWTQAERARLNAELHRTLTGLGSRYEGLFISNPSGRLFAGVLQDGGTSAYHQLDITDRAYFQKATSSLQPVVGDPVRSKVAGDPITVLFVPVRHGVDVVGFVGLSLKIQYIIDWIATQKIGSSGEVYLLDRKGAFIAHPDPSRILADLAATDPDWATLAKKMSSGDAGVEVSSFQGVRSEIGFAPIPDLGWSIAVTQHKGEFMAPVNALRANWAIIGIVCVALAMMICIVAGRSLSRPVLRAVDLLGAAADEVHVAAGHVSGSAQGVASMSTEQAAALEETSASLEELSSMAKENAQAAQSATRSMSATRETVTKADCSLRQVAQSMKAVCAASEASQKIVKTMDEIAFQTNILALNAAIEAARAGESGAGFAVVAEEVRALASRSAEAARQTATLIEQNIEKIHASDGLVQRTTLEFGELTQTAEQIERMLSGIASASAEQTLGVQQISLAVAQQDKAVQANAAASEESAAASAELMGQADSMRRQLATLEALVNGAATGVSAAPAVPPKNASVRGTRVVPRVSFAAAPVAARV